MFTISRVEMLAIPGVEVSAVNCLPVRPLVSVLMMTRNHAAYIQKAVDSVINQKTSFPFELLIGEDFSTDETRALCEALQAEYPSVIRLVIAERNVGITPNFLRLCVRAKGRYIALLEGDDYWTDDKKLQAQVDLMETHPEYVWCGALTANRINWADGKTAFSIQDILKRYIVHTSTALFRAQYLVSFPQFGAITSLDVLLFAYLSEQGPCGFINAEMSYYRRHEGGVWSGQGVADRMLMSQKCIDALDSYFSGRYRAELISRELWIYGMDTALQLNGAFWRVWSQSVRIVLVAWPRMVTRAPLSFAWLTLGVAMQPLAAAYHMARRKLAPRRRLELLGLIKPASTDDGAR